MTQVLDFVPIWTLILGMAVFFYVLLDGFDLGVGILFGFAPDTPARNLIMSSVAPVWDGNETWLVLGSVGLLAAFPLAFAIIIPALALAGVLAAKQLVPASAGTFKTDTPLFTGLLVGVILIVGGLTFFPAVSLGPIVEQLSHGKLF